MAGIILQVIQDTTAAKFRRLGSSSKGVSSDTLLHGWATNVGTVGTSANDVSALSTLGRVVWIMCSATDTLSPWMVRTS
jgi:hypothetical protein